MEYFARTNEEELVLSVSITFLSNIILVERGFLHTTKHLVLKLPMGLTLLFNI